jgi:hypothetical protein
MTKLIKKEVIKEAKKNPELAKNIKKISSVVTQ